MAKFKLINLSFFPMLYFIKMKYIGLSGRYIGGNMAEPCKTPLYLPQILINYGSIQTMSCGDLFLPSAANKGTDQTVQMRSLISAFLTAACIV